MHFYLAPFFRKLPAGMCGSPWADFDFDCPVSILTGCEKSNKTEGVSA